jgi:protein-L-isoaspartate(D-aspartate) O-methyltransferase
VVVSTEPTDMDYAVLRHRMVQEQLRGRGITDDRVLRAMETIPRHLFVPVAQAPHAYDDGPLPIGSEQTISQPYMVARMTELLDLTDSSRVLEIGTGSGYQTAVLADLAREVWTMERIPTHARRAEALLLQQGYANVHLITGDGTLGFVDAAPYDAILVTAAAPRVPDALRGQLAIGGRMVIPVTQGHSQELFLVEHPDEDSFPETVFLRCVFVPLIGKEGYKE